MTAWIRWSNSSTNSFFPWMAPIAKLVVTVAMWPQFLPARLATVLAATRSRPFMPDLLDRIAFVVTRRRPGCLLASPSTPSRSITAKKARSAAKPVTSRAIRLTPAPTAMLTNLLKFAKSMNQRASLNSKIALVATQPAMRTKLGKTGKLMSQECLCRILYWLAHLIGTPYKR